MAHTNPNPVFHFSFAMYDTYEEWHAGMKRLVHHEKVSAGGTTSQHYERIAHEDGYTQWNAMLAAAKKHYGVAW